MTEPAHTKSAEDVVKAAFGEKNRRRLIDTYFTRGPAPTAEAWKDVYRLLLWLDQTTGLAHCYESDKCQPGKNWYARALAFHDWVATGLGVAPSALATEVDWLFRRATSDLAAEVVRKAQRVGLRAQKQREPYAGRDFPEPGTDPELVSIITDVLGPHLSETPSPELWQRLVQRVRQYLMLENKRRNLLGEGFEDVLVSIIRRSPGAANLDLRTRQALHALPGFNPAGKNEKPNKVDLAILPPGRRILVTVKWSVRADRERQFASEFAEYIKAEAAQQPFEYVFVTNEFDPARLMRACERLSGNAYMFTQVVHVSTDALRATYGAAKEESMKRVLGYVESGRLVDLPRWLAQITRGR